MLLGIMKKSAATLAIAGLLNFAGAITVARNLDAAELVMFETGSCPWCARWHAEVGVVYAKTAEGMRAPLRRVDLDGPRPADLRNLGAVIYTPTFVLMEHGKEAGRILGYPGEDHFWGLLGNLLENLGSATRSTSLLWENE